MASKPITPRQAEVLRDLSETDFLRPMDVGGRDGSHHSATLAQLANLGLVERKKLHSTSCPYGCLRNDGTVSTRCRCKGSCTYRRIARARSTKKRESAGERKL
ncbi:MAG TPA: hypothetical protein VK571_06385 [Gemmatimonadaceae bacterium]|nr:hypothetical protein [Gemmatimonadaceae bacterium]